MSKSPHHRRIDVRPSCSGFTLIELLTVVAVLAAVAGIGWSAYRGVENDELDRLGNVQSDRLAQALRQFKADTGYWPGQGPFALASAANVETPAAGGGFDCSDTSAGLWLRSALPSIVVPTGVSDVNAWRADWFAHPANLWMLATPPRLCANHVLGRLQAWQAGSGRGWRGPYIEPSKLSWVDVGNGLRPDGSGDATDTPVQRDLRGLPAGRERPPLGAAYSDCPPAGIDCAFRWHAVAAAESAYDPARDDLRVRARPLLYFGPGSGRPRVAYAGPDGRFGGLLSAASCDPAVLVVGGADDRVICLD